MKQETKVMIESIKKMNTKSEDFFEIYKIVSDKYWTFEKPDDYQSAASCLVKFAEKGNEEDVVLCVKTIIQVVDMRTKNLPSAIVHFGFENGADYTVEIFKDGIARDQLQEALKNVSKAAKNGQFGKNYFKKGAKK